MLVRPLYGRPALLSSRQLSITRVAISHITHKVSTRPMATVKDSIPHVVRTAHERRHSGSWVATLSKIEQVNSTIRLLRLSLPKEGVRTHPHTKATMSYHAHTASTRQAASTLNMLSDHCQTYMTATLPFQAHCWADPEDNVLNILSS